MTPLRYAQLLYHIRLGAFGAGEKSTPMALTQGETDSGIWPSGLTAVDERGGFRGLTVVAGSPKLGKSLLSLRSALLAAEAGWSVWYLDGENNPRVFTERVIYHHGCTFEHWPDWMTRFHAQRCRPQFDLYALADLISKQVDDTDDKILIVVDSLNRMAKRSGGKGPNSYFEGLRKTVDWCSNLTTETDGQIAVLLVSEMNREGQAVGMDVEYAADVLLYVRPVDKREHNVELELVCRAGRSGQLGRFTRHYRRCGFWPDGLQVAPVTAPPPPPEEPPAEEFHGEDDPQAGFTWDRRS